MQTEVIVIGMDKFVKFRINVPQLQALMTAHMPSIRGDNVGGLTATVCVQIRLVGINKL